MASTQAFVLVKLTENDVPGARFIHANIADHTVFQLQRWLECRGLPTNGRKSQLVERCRSCIDSGKDGNISVVVDGGKWFQLKVMQQNSQGSAQPATPNVPVPPVTGWKAFPSVAIPSTYNYGHMYHYLVESMSFVTGQSGPDEGELGMDIHTAKPMRRAQQYVESGYVTSLQDTRSKGHYFAKGHVRSSFRDANHLVHATLSNISGAVVDASCDCRASAMGRCSHVGALLLFITEHVNKSGYEPVACTSQPCQWNQGSKVKTPQQIHKASYSGKAKFVKLSTKLRAFDPCDMERPPITGRVNSFLQRLQACNSGASWHGLLSFHYNDYSLCNERVLVLKELCSKFLAGLSEQIVELGGGVCMIPGTETQALSTEWHLSRWCRLTASVCKDIVHCTNVGRDNLVKKLLWGDKMNVKTKAMEYGAASESLALQNYVQMKAHIPGYQTIPTGLWVNQSSPELGCSPDGLVKDPTLNSSSQYGLLEIKCPYILKNGDPNYPGNSLTAQQQKSFCCHINKDGITLKKQHNYYYQIQMQLGITGLKWCDFVIWSKNGIHCERIQFDDQLWNKIRETCTVFFRTIYLPEYFEMRTPRGLSVFPLTM